MTMSDAQKHIHLHKLRKVARPAVWLAVIVVLAVGMACFAAIRHRTRNPQAAFFHDVLTQAPLYYEQQVKTLGATPVKGDTRAGCIPTYHGYPPGQQSPSASYPYDCLIHVSKPFAAPADANTGRAAVRSFAATAAAEGFSSKEGVTQNDSGAFYSGVRSYAGTKECTVQIAYFYARPASPGFDDAVKQSYLYDLNCGNRTYPYTPPGFPIGTVPQAGQ